jgi:L-lactate dehydrogenase complex protein LldG
MKATNLRENVLNKIRIAAKTNKQKFEIDEPDFKSPVFNKSDESLPEMFAKEFNKNYGKFIYCRNDKDFIQQYNQLVEANKWESIFSTEESLFGILDATNTKYNKKLQNLSTAEVGITTCEAIIARTGSIIVSSGNHNTRSLSVFPPIHIVVAHFDHLFFDLDNAFKFLREKYVNRFPSMISIISGPSRTADIEKTLVLGAHGPKSIYCFLINEK